jgi:surfactin synthase thioesterase subunit
MAGTAVEKVLCFPPAGGGPSLFTPWVNASPGLDVVALDLPGKERLFAEEPLAEVPSLVQAILPDARRAVAESRRLSLFGHCFGAVVAYELASVLELEGYEKELLLFASGSGAPGDVLWEPVTGAGDEEFLSVIGRNAGVSYAALEDPELRELILPALRADVAAHESYRPTAAPLRRCQLITVRGDQDTLVGASAAARWAEFGPAGLRSFELPGGHMYLTDQWGPLLTLIEKVLGVQE